MENFTTLYFVFNKSKDWFSSLIDICSDLDFATKQYPVKNNFIIFRKKVSNNLIVDNNIYYIIKHNFDDSENWYSFIDITTKNNLKIIEKLNKLEKRASFLEKEIEINNLKFPKYSKLYPQEIEEWSLMRSFYNENYAKEMIEKLNKKNNISDSDEFDRPLTSTEISFLKIKLSNEKIFEKMRK